MGALLVFQHETMSRYRGTRAIRDEMVSYSYSRDVSEKSEELVDEQTKPASFGVANAGSWRARSTPERGGAD